MQHAVPVTYQVAQLVASVKAAMFCALECVQEYKWRTFMLDAECIDLARLDGERIDANAL